MFQSMTSQFPSLCILLMLLAPNKTRSEFILADNPCVFPTPNNHLSCGIDDSALRRYNVCDPQKTVSMSQVEIIGKNIDAIYLKKENTCVCNNKSPKHLPCWYKFGFAFLERFEPLDVNIPSNYRAEYCSFNANKSPIKWKNWTRIDLVEQGQQFTKVIRKRWTMGSCGEDILFLIIMKRPEKLVRNKEVGRKPYIFVSFGPLVEERTERIQTNHLKTLVQIVTSLNNNLEHGYTLKAVIQRLLTRYTKALTVADNTWFRPKNRNHIPEWALWVFATCGVLLILMAIGCE